MNCSHRRPPNQKYAELAKLIARQAVAYLASLYTNLRNKTAPAETIPMHGPLLPPEPQGGPEPQAGSCQSPKLESSRLRRATQYRKPRTNHSESCKRHENDAETPGIAVVVPPEAPRAVGLKGVRVEFLPREELCDMRIVGLVLERSLCLEELQRRLRTSDEITIARVEFPEGEGEQDKQEAQQHTQVRKRDVGLEARN